MRRLLALFSFGLVLTTLLGACSSSGELEVTADTVVIDVRTPAEYAEGHLQGAINIDAEAASFGQQIATLPVDGDYILYCHSGRRAGIAKSIMESAGFTRVRNAGAIQDASNATNLPIVTDAALAVLT